MNDYRIVQVTEPELEELVRLAPDKLAEGLRFIDHQVATERGRLDVLLLDSDNALVVVELKVVEDDGMLVQGIDYYDYVQRNLSAFALAYHQHGVDVSKQPRLLLVAPSFSATLLSRAKWLDLPISLFTFQCIELGAPTKQRIVVYSEVAPPASPPPPETTTLDDLYGRMGSDALRELAKNLVSEAKSWSPEAVTVEPKKQYISIRLSNRVIAATYPQRAKSWLGGRDKSGEWVYEAVASKEGLQEALTFVRTSFERART